jgi:hypothetical protein
MQVPDLNRIAKLIEQDQKNILENLESLKKHCLQMEHALILMEKASQQNKGDE